MATPSAIRTAAVMDSICRDRDAPRSTTVRTAGRITAAALLGSAWHFGVAGPLAAPLLVVTVTPATDRRLRSATAFAYFLAGSSGLPAGAATFFGPGHGAISGYGLWIVSAFLLALPWAWASGGRGVLVALLLDAVPPLGCFGWLSPLTSAGIFFPGTGLAGLAALLGVLGCAGARIWPVVRAGLAAAALVNLLFLCLGKPPAPPAGWIGIDTRAGPVPGSLIAATMQRARWLATLRHETRRAHVVVLPETVAGPWWPGTAAQIRAAVPPGQTWLVGATAWVRSRRTDAVMKIPGADQEPRPLFISPFPVPVSMWRPWTHGSYQAGWWEPARTVAGVRVWAALCYDQLLPWVWVEGVIEAPRVVIAVSNDWWAQGTSAATIQRATTWGWTRLMGAALVRAENR